MLRRGAAAAAHHAGAQTAQLRHTCRKFLRRQVIAALGSGHSGVGLGHDGQLCPPAQLGDDVPQPVGTHGAVDADGVGPQGFQGQSHHRHCAAGEGPAALLKGHGHQHRQLLCDRPCRQQGGLGLIDVHDGLNGDQVHTGLHAGPDLPDIQLHRPIKGQRSKRLQQLSQRTHVQRHQAAEGCRRPSGRRHRRSGDLLGGIAAALQLQNAGAKGVGVDHVRPGLEVGPVDRFHLLRRPDAQKGRVLTGGQDVLDHGTHAAVQQHHALF